jgi:hypothetical protein
MANQERAKIVEQTDAILALEGFKASEAPQWYKDLTKEYVAGNITAEQVTKRTLEKIKSGNF